jgi:FtsZ-binding cell division protein ZapB
MKEIIVMLSTVIMLIGTVGCKADLKEENQQLKAEAAKCQTQVAQLEASVKKLQERDRNLYDDAVSYGGDVYKAAEELLKVSNMETMYEQTINQMVEAQMQQNPQMAKYKNIFMNFFKKYLGYESVKPFFVESYAKNFTGQELRDITAFYRTSTGQKTIKLVPQISTEAMMFSQNRLQEHMPELQMQILQEVQKEQAQKNQKQKRP